MNVDILAFVLGGVVVGLAIAPMWVSALRNRSGGSERSSKDMATDALLKAQGQRLDAAEQQLRVMNQWVTELCAQMVDAGLRPVTELEVRRRMGLLNGVAVHAGGRAVHAFDSDKGLREILFARFSVDDLRILAIDTGLGEDALIGESKTAKVLGLIARARERDTMRALVDAVERVRPGATADMDGP